VVWTSDRSGIPNVLAAAIEPATGRAAEPVRLTNLRTGAGYPSVDPDGGHLYFSGYHVDGWDVERIPFRPAAAGAAAEPIARFDPTMQQPRRGQSEAPVEPYSPLRTLLPTYWEVSYREGLDAPAIESNGVTLPRREVLGFSLGLETSGRDLVGRHAWSAAARMSTTGARFEGGGSYAFRGLGNPLVSVSARQTYPEAAQLLVDPDPDTLVLLTRRREVGAAVSLLAPKWRRDVSLTLQGGLAWDRRELLDPRLRASTEYALDRPTRRFATYGATLGLSTSRSHAFQMGLARGLALSVFGGIEQELAVPDSLSGIAGGDGTFGEVRGLVRAAIPLWGGGFARHTLALRGSAGVASGPGAGPLRYRVGGASGRLENLTGLELFGGTAIFFPVRAYPTSSRYGRYAWSATAEYRFPLWVGNVGLGPWPLHVDRTIGSIFFDAGNAWGPDVSFTGFSNPVRVALASVGAEVTTEFLGLYDIVLRVRGGAGVPLVEGDGARAWVRVGLPF
jgi:hypothetical protein